LFEEAFPDTDKDFLVLVFYLLVDEEVLSHEEQIGEYAVPSLFNKDMMQFPPPGISACDTRINQIADRSVLLAV
jgi:hypothetical protein